MRRMRLVIFVVVSAMIVTVLLLSPNNNNEVEDIKPYIQEIALRDGMEMSDSRSLKKDFGISAGEVEGFILYQGAVDTDVREVLVVKMSQESEAATLRKQLTIRLHEQLLELPDTEEETANLLKHARIISRGRFVLVAVSNDSKEIAGAFSSAVRK